MIERRAPDARVVDVVGDVAPDAHELLGDVDAIALPEHADRADARATRRPQLVDLRAAAVRRRALLELEEPREQRVGRVAPRRRRARVVAALARRVNTDPV